MINKLLKNRTSFIKELEPGSFTEIPNGIEPGSPEFDDWYRTMTKDIKQIQEENRKTVITACNSEAKSYEEALNAIDERDFQARDWGYENEIVQWHSAIIFFVRLESTKKHL